MAFDPTKVCPIPLQGEHKPCLKHSCQWFIQLHGTNPNTGQSVDEWGCAVAWLPVLLLENAKESRQAGAAIESFRNMTFPLLEGFVNGLSKSLNSERQRGEPRVVADGAPPALDDHSG